MIFLLQTNTNKKYPKTWPPIFAKPKKTYLINSLFAHKLFWIIKMKQRIQKRTIVEVQKTKQEKS